MRDEDVTHVKGVEYVSINEFAKRVGASQYTVRNRIRDGKLSATTLGKNQTKYIAWETGRTMWAVFPKNTNGRKSKPILPEGAKVIPFHKVDEKVSAPKVVAPKVDMPTVELPTLPPMEDMSSFSKEQYSDCLDESGEFDYDKLKVRLTSEAYKLKQDKDRNLLVEKSEVVSQVRQIAAILNNGLDSIPQRYTSILLAGCQTIIANRLNMPDFEFTEEERATLRGYLKTVGPEIMKSLKLVIEKMTEEEE